MISITEVFTSRGCVIATSAPARSRHKEETPMGHQAKVETDAAYPLPEHMRAWVLGDPGELSLVDKPIPGAVLVPRRLRR